MAASGKKLLPTIAGLFIITWPDYAKINDQDADFEDRVLKLKVFRTPSLLNYGADHSKYDETVEDVHAIRT